MWVIPQFMVWVVLRPHKEQQQAERNPQPAQVPAHAAALSASATPPLSEVPRLDQVHPCPVDIVQAHSLKVEIAPFCPKVITDKTRILRENFTKRK